MKNRLFKTILCQLLSLLMIGATMSLVSCGTGSSAGEDTADDTAEDTAAEEPAPKKSIDIYIIAGQSNGSGYTYIDRDVLKSLWDECMVGDPHVLYTGRAEYTIDVNMPSVSTRANKFEEWVNAKAGQGMSTSHMGAEVGMAKVFLEKYYNEETGKTAGIIKFAHGGTSLLPKVDGENAANGNWVSPSYAKAEELSYEDYSLYGGLYRDLLAQVEKSVADLKALEYDDINLKAVFWMQGESDVSAPNKYKTAFEYFLNDLRRDLGAIVGEDLSDLAVVVGEISRTSGSANPSHVTVNEKFIEMQRGLAEDFDNVYVIPSGQFEINTWVNNADVNLGDCWHWGTEAMFNIGAMVADCIIENVLAD